MKKKVIKNERLKILSALILGVALYGQTLLAQSVPSPDSSDDAQETQDQLSTPEVITFSCEVLNPEEISNSEHLGNYSIRAFNSVNLAFSPQTGIVGMSIKLSGGRYSLAPINPRVYRTAIKSAQALQGEIQLKNVNREEVDKIILKPNFTGGKIVLDNAELNISCEENF